MTELHVIRKKIRDRLNEIADELALGVAKDYSEYKYLTGIVSGLAMVERDVLDMIERTEQDD